MKRVCNAMARFGIDFVAIVVAFMISFLLRLDFSFDWQWFLRALVCLPFVALCEFLGLYLFGATRAAWRFISISDVWRILLALSVAQIPLVAMRLIVGSYMDDVETAQWFLIPVGVLFINWVLVVALCVGVRVLRRMIFEKANRLSFQTIGARAILIGSGSDAKQIAESLRNDAQSPFDLVGIMSESPEDAGRVIAGVPVLGNMEKMSQIVDKYEIEQAIIVESDNTAESLRGILDACAEASIKTKIIPRMNALISGKVDIAQMREISVEDLLHRDPISLDKDEISRFLHGRRILVTGAGGSIGSELCRQVLAFEPTELVLLERCELFLYAIEREMREKAKSTKIIARLVDICDESRLDEVFVESRPEVDFHAAAYKHVPLLEFNPGEAIRNNVEGTAAVADCALRRDVAAFVMISTDKAVNPTSVMGTSKRIAELYIQGMSGKGKTRFCAVRFGNVLGSTGSVLPLFRQQIRQGGPLTVTHADMVRYFMTIPEASQLVMQAAAMAQNGEIFVLDMGKPVKIVDLARDLIRLSGKTERDIPIVFSGVRPGEKLFEEIGFNEECMDRTRHPKIYVGKIHHVDLEQLKSDIADLSKLRDSQDNARVREAMHKIVPEMLAPEPIGSTEITPSIEMTPLTIVAPAEE